MATLRELLTPEEQERFKKLHNQGYFNEITLPRFTERFGRELRYIDLMQHRLDADLENYRLDDPSIERTDYQRRQLQHLINTDKENIAKRRAGVFDSVVQGDLWGRGRRDLQDLDLGLSTRPDGTRLPTDAGLFTSTEADKSIAQLAWDKYWDEKGIVRGTLDVGASAVTGSIRGVQQIGSGQGLGEHPLEAIAEIGAILPIGRAAGRLIGGTSRRLAPVGRVARSGWLQIPAQGAELADILGAREDVFLEALSEAGLEAVGAGGDVISDLRSGRIRQIFQGLDPQAAEDAQTAESTTEHDNITGSRTAPGVIPDSVARASADSAVESADAQTALFTAEQQQQTSQDQDLRRQAWERMLVESEAREAAEAEQAQIEQSFIDQDDAFTQQQSQQAQTAEAEAAEAAAKIEHTKTWLPFYSDLAGGSQSEGIRTLNAEYDAGVRDPIRQRYDAIATSLSEQLGAIPSELHRETDRRLRQLIGEKWHNVYRGIDQKPTPQERAQRAAETADTIVQGETDAESPTEPTEPTSAVGTDAQTAPADTAQTATGEQIPADETPAETIPQTQIGTETVGYESDGTTGHRVRPVLRELDDLVPSHDLAGEKRTDYPEDLQPREGRGGAISMEQVRNTARQPNFAFLLEFFKQFRDGAPVTSKQHPRRILSGNGRTLSLQLMRQNYPENWQGYQEALRAELEKVGIDPAEADAMQSPVLTYEVIDDTNEVELAKDANVQATLDNTATEQAGQDAAYFDDDLMALYQPGEGSFQEVLTSTENQPFRTALFNRIPTHLVSAFMTSDNKNFSNDGIQRIQNAMLRYVFGGEIGDQLSKVFIETGLEGTKNVETMLRNSIASLAYAKANGQDISTDLASAIFRYLEINNTAEREAQQRKQPKDVMLYAGIDALYKTGEMIAAPTLLEKQLLYLIYAKRNAPRQLADDFQRWSEVVVSMSASEEGGLFDANTSTAIFAGMIRDHIRDTIFETRQTQDGRTVLLPPDSMPPELVSLREDMDAIATTEGKQRFANDWIDAFLRVMNEGEAQNETDTDSEAATVRGTPAADTGTPRDGEPESSQGEPDPTATGTPETPESPSGVAGTQPGGTDRDASRGTQGATDRVPADDRGSAVAIEEALQIVSVGTVSLDEWTAASTEGKTSFLQKQERAIPVHLQTGAITAEQAAQKQEAIALLRQNIQEVTDENNTVEPDTAVSAAEDNVDTTEVSSPEAQTTETPIDTNQVVGVSRRIAPTASTVSPVVQRALDALGISTAEWEQLKTDGAAIEFLNSQPQETDAQLDAVADLAGDIAGEMPADAMVDEDLDFEDDEDLFSDVETGVLKDITDQHRSDFDTVRRKLFLATAIARLQAKGQDRTPIETAQLRALEAPQRTDAQQEIYQRLLTAFVDQQVARLEAKPAPSATETRILEALTAVQAEGLPEEASELSLYSDLETPDQEHSRTLSETKTLAGVQAPDTSDTDLNLPVTVTQDKTKLSPAQQTSVKAIVSAFLRKIHTDTDTTVQGGFLLADKPGVGKTRQALATIWHYMREGINKHFVLAPNAQLLNNYSTDMQAMGGSVGDISNYDSSNQQLKTPIGTATYSMLTRKPSVANFTTTAGNQNAIADIVEHLSGARPTLQQTHPETYQASLEAFLRILPNLQTPVRIEAAVKELRRQAQTVNLDNPANVEQFRQRVTPDLADLLLAERSETGQQELIATGAEGSELYTRVQQLLTFAEKIITAQPDPDFAEKSAAFAGVIVLDEMHKVAGTRSEIGRTIETLHDLLPNAKFLYMSATPFKEIDNFWIANRLGLWGANQPFPSFTHFRNTFRRAARAVKEVVPLHLKQMGRYLSRALSSRETRYTPVEVPLTNTEKAQYDTAVQLVQGIRQQFEGSIEAAMRTPWGAMIENDGEFHQYRAKYMRMFYGEIQKFFLAVLDSMKAQGIETGLREKLEAGDKVIVQLENTWDATTKRAEARGQSAAGPFDLLIDFVSNENTFPVHEHITETRTRRSDGSQYTVVVPREVYDTDGQRVRSVDGNLKRLQTELLGLLQREMQETTPVLTRFKSLGFAELPFAADIIHAIAAEAGVASGEISGRSDTDREALATAFSETTDVNLIILGPAGLTGINLPIKESLKDKVNNLYHYLVQSSWNVNTFEQGLGRGKRSNSAIDPQYQIVHQDLPGADRVLGATLAKFAEMGALAGQADNALMQNIDKVEGETSLDDDPEADVFEETTQEGERSHVFGIHGQEALGQLWLDIYEAGEFEIADTLGLVRPEIAGDTGFLDPATVPSVQQFFQRLLHQSTAEQPRLYEQFETRLKRIIAYRRELGQLDVGANDLNSRDGQIVDKLTIFTDPDTGQTAEMVRLSVQRKLPRRGWEFTQKVIRGDDGYEQHGRNFEGVYTDADGNVWAVFAAPIARGQAQEYIRWGPRGTPVQGIHLGAHRITAEELAADFTAVSEPSQPQLTDLAEAQRLWETEDGTADTHVDSELFMATGLILPKWQDLSTKHTRHAQMAVIPMLDGSHLHGRLIPSSVLPEVLTQIGGVDPNYFSNQPSTVSRQQDPPPNGEGVSDIDIPSIVRDIIGQATDPKIAARLENIVEHIHKKLPLRLRGHRVRNAAEAALLGQLIRDPQVEHTWIVYRKDERIVKIEPISLSRKGETKAGDFAHIKRETGRLQADSILRIHNHPSGVAKWSQADKNAAINWHRELGTLMAEDIIVDSGTYAYRQFINGEYTWHEDTVLDPGTVEWATGTQAVSDTSGERKPTDPLYENPLIRGAREAATYMMGIKRRTEDVAELIYVDTRSGKIANTFTDTTLRASTDPVQYIQSALMSAKGQQVHIVMWGDDAAVSLARTLQGVEGVDSAWVNSQRVTGLEHIGQETDAADTDVTTDSESDTEPDTITITIGDQDHTLVRMPDDDSETDTLSDVNNPLSKPVVIAGVSHEMVRDSSREDLGGLYNRRGDAEHIVGPRKLKVSEEAKRYSEYKQRYSEFAKKELGLSQKQTKEKLRIVENIYQKVLKNTRRDPDKQDQLKKMGVSLRKAALISLKGFIFAGTLSELTGNIKTPYPAYAPADENLRRQLWKLAQEFVSAPSVNTRASTVEDTNILFDSLYENLTEKQIYERVKNEGVIQASHPSGDLNTNQGLLAYASYGPYYRRGGHSYGYILDLNKMLDEIPGIVGTIHKRGNWLEKRDLTFEELREAITAEQGGDPDTVIEIRIPQDIDVNEYLLGIIEDNEVYVKSEETTNDSILSDYTAEVQRTNPDSVVYRVHPPENLAMEGRGRAKTAEIGEKALNTFVDANAGIMKVLKAWSPTARRWARLTKNEFVSGFGRIRDLEAPEGSDTPSPADVLIEILDERQYISKSNAGRALGALQPHLLTFNKLATKRVKLRTEVVAPRTRKATRTELSRKVFNFIEYDTAIENDAELLAIAEPLKEAWRELLIYDTQKIVELMGELETINEKLYVTDAAGKREEWYGVPFDGFEWDPERKGYVKDGKFYTIEEAHRAANQLYMPHYFRGTSPLQEYSALQKQLDALNTLLAADTIDAADLQKFGIQFDTGTSMYTHQPTGKTASTPYEMVRIVADYLATEDAALQGILNYYDEEGRIGYYGHLERTRETDDRFYVRDISLMAENRIRLWDRLAEVAVLGQQHPLLGDSPRMKTLIEQVLNFNKTPREAALRKVAEALNSGQEGMFERMPQFASGVDVALDIMQHWMERDADGQKTGNYQEIDIGRMNLDAETLAELERIGLIKKDSDGNHQIVGADINQRHATMARHIHEFYNTLAIRKKAVHSLVLGLGNWHTRDPLEMESAEFWKKINDSITVLTLNHGVAIQNLLEIPMVSAFTGASPFFKGMKNVGTNTDYRNTMQQLGRGLSHARNFMADTSLADKYLGLRKFTYFSKSDEFSRATGLGVGLENAIEKIQRYAVATSDKKRAALGRDMDSVRLNKDIINAIPASELQGVLEAAKQLILDRNVETVFSSEKGGDLSHAERLAGTIQRSMFYISDRTFKPYDARSLPQYMLSRNPLIRVFMKYKSWMMQHTELVYNLLKRAYREAKRGNLEPLGNFVAASAMMGLGTTGLLWLYSGLQGDDDDKTVQERFLKGFAAAQTFGLASVLFELGMYAEGNWYQMQNLLAKQAAGPAFSVAAQMIAPVFTGDFAQAGEEAIRRLPIVSFSRRVGGWRLLEEATGIGEEE